MKVAITAMGEALTSPVDRTFGRARWFVVVDEASSQFQAITNQQNVEAAQGAGIQSAQQMVNQGVGVLLTGNVGPNAFRALTAASIRIFQFNNDVQTVSEALEAWKAGRLQEVKDATAKGHGF